MIDLEIIEEPAPQGFLSTAPPSPPLRVFSDEHLQASIDKVLNSLPADRKAAEVNVGFDERGVAVIGVFKTANGWSVLGGVSWDRGGAWGGQVSVRKEWS